MSNCLLSKWRPRKERQRTRLPNGENGEWKAGSLGCKILESSTSSHLSGVMKSSGLVDGAGVLLKLGLDIGFPISAGSSLEVWPAHFWGFSQAALWIIPKYTSWFLCLLPGSRPPVSHTFHCPSSHSPYHLSFSLNLHSSYHYSHWLPLPKFHTASMVPASTNDFSLHSDFCFFYLSPLSYGFQFSYFF